MNYNLNQLFQHAEKLSNWAALKKLFKFIIHEKNKLVLAFSIIFLNASLNLLGPLLIGYTIDNFIVAKEYSGLIKFSFILLLMYCLAFLTSYLQTNIMGSIGQRLLFSLRNAIFSTLQKLPVDFFNQNQSGDLISRVNNDTDNLNQFFSQALMQFVSSIFMISGATIFLLSLNWKLGLATITPAIIILLFTKALSPWVKRKNAETLKSTGNLSADIQENLQNFKVVIAFNRRDYFKERFNQSNHHNYEVAVKAGIANNLFLPTYSLLSNFAQLIALTFGIYLISKGEFTIGLLVSYLSYTLNVYNPLRQIASIWSTFQLAMASWDRVSLILSLESNLPVRQGLDEIDSQSSILEFQNVSFSYPDGKNVLHHINLKLKKGKTYALIGPTGGGKTTTASLMARLYDPTEGEVFLQGRNLKSYSATERTQKIGYILQDPLLFSGTIQENILLGNEELGRLSKENLANRLEEYGLSELLKSFKDGLNTEINTDGNSLSLGQKQVIAFIRAVLRNPDLLILDEATANIDTVTEQTLEKIIQGLPDELTIVIIAHRLNTIQNADEIFFINAGEVNPAGSLEEALSRLNKNDRTS